MKYLYGLLVITLAGACKQTQIGQPIQPTQLVQTNTNHLIAFSKDSLPALNGIRLVEVHLDGRRFLKFIYKNGYLTDEINYSTDSRAIYLSTDHYNRDKQGLIKIETRGRKYDEGVIGTDTTLLLYSQTFSRLSDLSVSTGYGEYIFNKNGSLLEQVHDYLSVVYNIDSRNNIIAANTTIKDGDPNSTTSAAYKYDNQLNPFRTTGRISLQSRYSTFETDYSPNNVSEMVFSNPKTNYINTVRYEYEYRPDGYPTKLTIYDSNDQVYKPAFEFIYTK